MFIGERGSSYTPPFIQAKRVSYVFTSGDDANGFAQVPVEWDVPFEDNNYTVSWGANDTDLIVDLNFFVGDIHFKTATGFTAVVRNFSPGAGGDGDTVIVNAIAIHD
jgi:hypothetical protein